jgi:hypothetical protein
MVLCSQVSLNSLSIGSTTGINVISSLVRSNERDGLDSWFVNNEVYGVVGSVDNVEDSRGESCLAGKVGENHGSTGAGEAVSCGCGADDNGPLWVSTGYVGLTRAQMAS